MEFQVTEAIELIKTLAETENLTHAQALTAFVAEAGLDLEYASQLKAALFEEYTLKEMASDSMTKALYSVFVSGESAAQDIQEVDTKETQEGTKYKVRVKDKASGSSYVRYATREKVAELRANPNIASVEMTDYGTTGEDDRGQRTAAAKTGRDYDGDGKKESSSKEHAGVVHNAIQRKMGGKPDGQDTRREEFELEEGKKEADLDKMKRQSNKHMKDAVGKRSKSDSDSKNKSFKMDGIRRSIERGEDPRRDTYGGKRTGKDGTHPPEDHRKAFTHTPLKDRPAKEPGVKKESAWESYLELREARAKTKEEASKKLEAHRAAMKDGGESPYFGKQKKAEGKDPWSTHPSDAKAHKKEDMGEGYKGKHGQSDEEHMDSRSDAAKQISGDSKHSGAAYSHRSYKGVGKPAKPGERQEHQGKMTKADRDELKIRKDALKKKTQKEEVFLEADLVDAGRENQSQRSRKKLDGKDVDNSKNIVLMPHVNESIKTEHEAPKSAERIASSVVNETLRAKIRDMAEACCDKCGTPECTCESKNEEKPKKKKVKIDEAGMPIIETKAESRNNARPGPSKEMIDPPADPLGPPGHMNPKGEPKRYKEAGEAPGDRRPNRKKDKSLPFETGTVPNGSGV